MATTVLEQIRQTNEDIENLERAAAKLLADAEKNPPKYKPIIEHSVKRTVLRIQELSKSLLELYADRDGLKKDEAAFLAGMRGDSVAVSGESKHQQLQTDVWLNFYDKLKEMRDYHKKFGGNLSAVPEVHDETFFKKESLEIVNSKGVFSTEEHFGQRLDLSPHFTKFVNWAKNRKVRENDRKGELDYITYLKTFERFHEIPRYLKYRETFYIEYLQNLLEYLRDFFKRQNPLADHAKVLRQFEADFERRYNEQHIPEWVPFTHKLPFYSRPTDKLLASEGTFKGHASGKKYEKAMQALQQASLEEQKKRLEDSEAHDRQLGRLEGLIQRYRDLLAETLERTVRHLQKKQSRTLKEIEAESDEEDQGLQLALIPEEPEEEEDSDDDGRPVYNPLNLPLGWDGKPIPFWMYKLHGLGTELKCEICGNYSYWGRRAFERHFQEWRHAYGMRCLKIPNTVHFKEITQIEDAIQLYEKLRKEAEIHAFRPDQDIECEDAEGNVMNVRDYEALRRQGLI